MKIELIKMKLQNFKSHKEKEIDFSSTTNIKGINGVGKTSIADAYMWVLFDKMADGTQADKIRPHDGNGVDIDFIDITVEIDIAVDGKPINIVKTQKQKWTTPRGCTDKRFDGNVNEYIVNTIPKSQTDFKKYFELIIAESVFRSCSSVADFFKMKTKERRELLFSLVSVFSDLDVISKNPSLEPMRELLVNYTLEELVSRNTKAIKDTNKSIEDIPTRIDEATKSKVDIDVAELELQKNALLVQIKEVEVLEEKGNKMHEVVSELSNKIMQTQFSINDISRSVTEKNLSLKREVEKRKQDAFDGFNKALAREKFIMSEIESLKTTNLIREESKLLLGDKWKVLIATKFDEESLICPTCHQEYPQDMKDNALELFEADKEKKKADINRDGNEAKTTIENNLLEIAKLETELKAGMQKKIDFNKIQGDCIEELKAIPNEPDLSADANYKALTDKLAELNKEYDSMDNGADYRATLRDKKELIQTELRGVESLLAKAENNVEIDERIAEHIANLRKFKQVVANLQKEENLFKQFKRTKNMMLTDEINSHLKIVKFKLFEPTISGGDDKEICEPTIGGTLYSNGLNKGHRILADIDILETLQRIHGVSLPIFLDNAEQLSSNNIPVTESQLIMLSVSDDKTLIVEA